MTWRAICARLYLADEHDVQAAEVADAQLAPRDGFVGTRV
jgi:hypothetical protein